MESLHENEKFAQRKGKVEHVLLLNMKCLKRVLNETEKFAQRHVQRFITFHFRPSNMFNFSFSFPEHMQIFQTFHFRSPIPQVHIFGAGIAGLATAVYCQIKGLKTKLYEAANHAGGRCRSFHDSVIDRVIDNGNHLILGGGKTVTQIRKITKNLRTDAKQMQKCTVWYWALPQKLMRITLIHLC